MATRKCRNIYFPKYFMAFRRSKIFIISRNILVLLLILMLHAEGHVLGRGQNVFFM